MPFVFIAASGSQPESLDDLIRAPSRLLIGSAGEQSTGHLAIERLRGRRGASIDPVAYNGGIAAMHAVATKQALSHSYRCPQCCHTSAQAA